MRRRALLVPMVLLVAACGSGSPDAQTSTTIPDITLLATTTTSTTSTTISTTTTTSSTTTSSAPPTTLAPATSTTVDPVIAELVLSSSGIGSATFGSDPDAVVDYVTLLLGPPTQDTGWVDPLSIGPCPGSQMRLVAWGGLVLEFGDVSAVASDRPHFSAYKYGVDGEIGVPPVGLLTEQGITTASRVAELVTAYPDAVLNPEDEFSSPNFYVSDEFRGLLTGLESDDLVTLIAGGRSCRE